VVSLVRNGAIWRQAEAEVRSRTRSVVQIPTRSFTRSPNCLPLVSTLNLAGSVRAVSHDTLIPSSHSIDFLAHVSIRHRYTWLEQSPHQQDAAAFHAVAHRAEKDEVALCLSQPSRWICFVQTIVVLPSANRGGHVENTLKKNISEAVLI